MLNHEPPSQCHALASILVIDQSVLVSSALSPLCRLSHRQRIFFTPAYLAFPIVSSEVSSVRPMNSCYHYHSIQICLCYYLSIGTTVTRSYRLWSLLTEFYSSCRHQIVNIGILAVVRCPYVCPTPWCASKWLKIFDCTAYHICFAV